MAAVADALAHELSLPALARACAHSRIAVPKPSPSRLGLDLPEQVAAAEVGAADDRRPGRPRRSAVSLATSSSRHSSWRSAQAVVGLADLGDVAGDHELGGALRRPARWRAAVHQAVTSRRCTTRMPVTTRIAAYAAISRPAGTCPSTSLVESGSVPNRPLLSAAEPVLAR